MTSYFPPLQMEEQIQLICSWDIFWVFPFSQILLNKFLLIFSSNFPLYSLLINTLNPDLFEEPLFSNLFFKFSMTSLPKQVQYFINYWLISLISLYIILCSQGLDFQS